MATKINIYSLKAVFMASLVAIILGCNTTKTENNKLNYLNQNKARLNDGLKAISDSTYGTIHSVLIMQNNELIFEKYFNGWTKDSLHMMQSATKSVIATLMGIAIQEGYIQDVNQKVLSFYEHKPIENINTWKEDMTIEDLLTQQHGLKWQEAPWNSPDNTWRKLLATQGDWYTSILSTPMECEPGTLFNYSNAAPVLTSGIIQEASKMSIDSFAKRYLFKPLEINSYRFWQGNDGPKNNGLALLFLTSRDMLKIGQLYLNNGRWNNKQILPTTWTKKAAKTPITENHRDNRFYRFGYGYFWWNTPKASGNNPETNSDIYLARGDGGQYIIIDPKHKIVAVITAWDLQKGNYIFNLYTRYFQPEIHDVITPKLFAESILSTHVEISATLTPNNRELYFAKKDSFYANNQKSTIYKSININGNWSKPQIASFSGSYSDSSPFVTPNGKRIYFTSNRPISGDTEKQDRDIWYVEKENNTWGAPKYLSIYNSEKSEYSPTLDKYGNLYFSSYREGGLGSGDIWVSYLENNTYQTPINLGSNINTNTGEWGGCISPNGDFFIYEASGRDQNITHDGDLYISYFKNNKWSKSQHLNALNSGGSDLSPKIHNNMLYFASNRHSNFQIEMNNNNVDLYTIPLDSVMALDKN
ncbi:serine hydrolase [uncultured Psychroserpens sp.]|uniref:serine hydrolase domain-containing protein n=1 Tax=uncultured Psychroserpens sp. TaxID=255436 RepID=UPI00260F890F|nr:serine hydrolase [uncultured Psychroserpens sp.]